MDKIIIHDATFRCNVGISEEEREQKQEILVRLEITKDLQPAATTDKIQDTLDYYEIHKEIKGKIERKAYNLIESIAEEIAEIIPAPVKVTVKKTAALENTTYAAVQITRT